MSGPVAPSASYNAVEAGRRKHDEFEIQKIVPLSTMKELRRVYRQSPVLEQVRSLLQKSVWSAGMGFFKENLNKNEGQFSKKGHRVEWNPPSFVKETVERHWQKFKHDALDSLLCFGWCVVHFNDPQESGEPIVDEREKKYPFPTVVPCELYRLMICTSLKGGTKLVALHNRHETELPDTVVYANYGFNPTCDGVINSLVAKAYSDVVFLEEHTRAHMRIKSIRCNPTVIIESSSVVKNESTGSKLAARKAFVGKLGEESVGIPPADNLRATSVTEGAIPFSVHVNPRAVMDRDDLILRRARREMAFRRGDVRAASMIDIPEDVSGGDRKVNTAAGITLDEGETAKFMPAPSESTDFTMTRHTVTQSISGVFGVPLTVLMGSALSGHGRGSVGENNSRIVHSMFRLTVSEWRQRLADVLTKAFQEAYFELLVSAPIKREANDGAAAGKSKDAIDAYSEAKKRMIHVDFNPTTFIDNHELRELYCWGVIDFDCFSRFAMSNASLPLSDRVKHPPKHPLGLGYEQAAQPAAQDKQAKPVAAPKEVSSASGGEKKSKSKSKTGSPSTKSVGTKRKGATESDAVEETDSKKAKS